MAANALMIWRAFWSSNHPAAKFAREISWQLIWQSALIAAALVIGVIIVRSIA